MGTLLYSAHSISVHALLSIDYLVQGVLKNRVLGNSGTYRQANLLKNVGNTNFGTLSPNLKSKLQYFYTGCSKIDEI